MTLHSSNFTTTLQQSLELTNWLNSSLLFLSLESNSQRQKSLMEANLKVERSLQTSSPEIVLITPMLISWFHLRVSLLNEESAAESPLLSMSEFRKYFSVRWAELSEENDVGARVLNLADRTVWTASNGIAMYGKIGQICLHNRSNVASRPCAVGTGNSR